MSEDHDQLDPAEALMREVGAQLRRVRLERGQDLDEVGQHLRIKSTYLHGIEQGDLSTMPGRTYALGFLRSYADYLGFDGDDLITQIKSTVANLTDRTRLRMRAPLPESRLPKTPILVLSLAALAGIYAGWSYLNHGSQLVIETVAEVPANLRNLAAGAFREGDAGGAPPAADAARALPPPITTQPKAREGQSAVARATPAPAAGSSTDSAPSSGPLDGPLPATGGPPPERMAAAPATVAPAPPPATAAITAPAPAPATGPAEKAEPDLPAVPRVAPQGGPEAPTNAARTYALARPDAAEPPAASSDRGAGSQPDAPAADAPSGAPQDRVAALPLDPAVIGPVGRIEGQENSDARVVLKALESSWIQISSPAGDYLRSRTLEPNDVFLVPNRPDLELWTGNAGGLEVIVDGTVLAPLGTSGAVVRGVALDPASLRARLGRPLAH